ncbi:MAG: ATP-binding protein [Candidatus Paceibacteria bacterium]
MQVKFNFKTLRFFQLVAAICVSTAIFSAAYWLINMFYPEYDYWIISGIYFLCAGLAITVVGSGDSAVQNWYQSELLSAQELFSTLYDQSPVPYITLNSSGVITICNQAAANLFKTNAKNLVGKQLNTFITHENNDKLSVILGTIRAGTSMQQTEAKIVAGDKEEIWINISIFHSARLSQRLVSLVDINTHKIVDKAKSEFVSLATHQLRTPITAIKWNLDLLTRSLAENLSEKQTDYLQKASRNVVRMIALINDFLSVSKLETGTFSTITTSVQLDEFLMSVIDEYQQTIEEKSILIKTNFQPPALRITTDENLFHIVTSNILSNAVKYTKENADISISYSQAESNFILTIADSGIGIPAHELDNLFKKFFRATNAQVIRAEGTGLGMYIVKESVEKLGGTITVESTENVGTTFTITLPIEHTVS